MNAHSIVTFVVDGDASSLSNELAYSVLCQMTNHKSCRRKGASSDARVDRASSAVLVCRNFVGNTDKHEVFPPLMMRAFGEMKEVAFEELKMEAFEKMKMETQGS